MKQLILCFSVICLCQVIQAQNNRRFDNIEYKSALKFNLLSPIIGAIAVNYENKLNNDASFIASASYFTGQIDNTTEPIRGFVASLEYRFYTGNEPMRGLYLQPYARYQYFKDIQTKTDELSVPGLGLLGGYQYIFAKRIVFDMNFGPAYNFGTLTSPQNTYGNSDLKPMFRGYWMRGGISVGFLF
jgi:hypothetical protein